MTKNYLLAIDLGTSGCKITVFDFKGSPMASWIVGMKPIIPVPICRAGSGKVVGGYMSGIKATLCKGRISPEEIGAMGWMAPAGPAFP